VIVVELVLGEIKAAYSGHSHHGEAIVVKFVWVVDALCVIVGIVNVLHR
jgi:hypothetical protein